MWETEGFVFNHCVLFYNIKILLNPFENTFLWVIITLYVHVQSIERGLAYAVYRYRN